jgi:hypothetical protein
MNTLTESDRKMLTVEVLGEEFYPFFFEADGKSWKKIGDNRTFTTPQDMYDLMTALQKAGKWANFISYLWDTLRPACNRVPYPISDFIADIFQPTTSEGIHFAWLVKEWLKGEK